MEFLKKILDTTLLLFVGIKEKEKNQKKEKKAKILIKIRHFMTKIVLKRIKKPGGGTRTQKVKIDSKGRWKFVKNTTKGMVRKTRAKGRLAYEKVKKKTKRRSTTKRKSNKPRKKSNSMKLPKFGKTAKKIAIGLGAAQLAAIVVGFIAPQIVPIAKPPDRVPVVGSRTPPHSGLEAMTARRVTTSLAYAVDLDTCNSKPRSA